MKQILLLFSLTFSFLININAQNVHKGKDFWFAFPPTLYSHEVEGIPELKLLVWKQTSLPHSFVLKSGDTILFEDTDTSPAANGPVEYIIPIEYSLDLEGEIVLDKGLHFNSSHNVIVRAKVERVGSLDVSTIYPKETLRTEYFIIGAPGASFESDFFESYSGKSNITIVASEDNTDIVIIPSVPTEQGGNKNTPINITLNKGEIYLVRPSSISSDLSGSLVKACKPIAVFSGTETTANPVYLANEYCCADRIWAQMPPIEYLGTEYLLVPIVQTSESEKKHSIKIVATQDDTKVMRNGDLIATLDAGRHHFLDLVQNASIISSDKPILVAQFMINFLFFDEAAYFNEAGDPSMLIIPPITAKSYNIKTKNVSDFPGNDKMVIIAKQEDIANFEAVGVDIISVGDLNYFKSFTPDNGYRYDILDIDTNNGYVSLVNSGGFQAYTYFLGNALAYMYNADYHLEPPNEIIYNLNLPNEICINTLFSPTAESNFNLEGLNYLWNFGDGNSSTEVNPDYQYQVSGEYIISLDLKIGDCEKVSLLDTINIIGTSTENLSISGENTVSPFDSLIYTASVLPSSATEWSIEGGEIISSNQNEVVVIWDNQQEPGVLSISEITTEGCVGSSSELQVDIQFFEEMEGTCVSGHTLYPNPVSDMLYLNLFLSHSTNLRLDIFNSLGQRISSEEVSVSSGSNVFDLKVKDYPAGIYFIKLTGEGCKSGIKWVKIRE